MCWLYNSSTTGIIKTKGLKMKNTFEAEVLYSLKVLSFCHYYKVPSPPPRSKLTRFYTPRPYDFFLLKDGTFCALELKSTTRLTAFPLSKFTEFQLNSLREVKDFGGLALVLIRVRGKRRGDITAYAFEIGEILQFMKEGKVSIPKDAFLSAYQVPREKVNAQRYVWRLDLLWQHFRERCSALSVESK